MLNEHSHVSRLTSHVSRLRAFNQFDIRPWDDGLRAVSEPDFHHADFTLGRNLLEIGRQTRDFADLSKQRVSNDANLVADPDAFPLRNGCRAVTAQCACASGNDDLRPNDAGSNLRGA